MVLQSASKIGILCSNQSVKSDFEQAQRLLHSHEAGSNAASVAAPTIWQCSTSLPLFYRFLRFVLAFGTAFRRFETSKIIRACSSATW